MAMQIASQNHMYFSTKAKNCKQPQTEDYKLLTNTRLVTWMAYFSSGPRPN